MLVQWNQLVPVINYSNLTPLFLHMSVFFFFPPCFLSWIRQKRSLSSRTFCEPITQTMFGGGLGCIWSHHISSVKANAPRCVPESNDGPIRPHHFAIAGKYQIIARLLGDGSEKWRVMDKDHAGTAVSKAAASHSFSRPLILSHSFIRVFSRTHNSDMVGAFKPCVQAHEDFF